MTREEEIKERLAAAQCTSKGIKYIMDAKDMLREHAEDDLCYLLSRNEELQRRVEKMEKSQPQPSVTDAEVEAFGSEIAKMQAVVDAARAVTYEYFHPATGDGDTIGKMYRMLDAIRALEALDAEEK